MATVVLQAAGAGLGTLLGGPLGGLLGRAIGAVAGSFIDGKLFGDGKTLKGPRLSDLRVMASSEGAPIPRVWGRMRVPGQGVADQAPGERRGLSKQCKSRPAGGL